MGIFKLAFGGAILHSTMSTKRAVKKQARSTQGQGLADAIGCLVSKKERKAEEERRLAEENARHKSEFERYLKNRERRQRQYWKDFRETVMSECPFLPEKEDYDVDITRYDFDPTEFEPEFSRAIVEMDAKHHQDEYSQFLEDLEKYGGKFWVKPENYDYDPKEFGESYCVRLKF